MNKSIKNIIFSFSSQLLILLLGFLVPRIIMQNYGSDTNGVTNTITQIFTYLALLEAGIAQATSNSLYKYLNEKHKDKNNISTIMSLSQSYFKKVSYLYGIGIIVVSILLPLLLKTSLSFKTLSLYIFFEGLISLVSFYYIQSWNALLQVDGKSYVVANIELVNKVLFYAIKIIFALKSINIVYIQVGCFFISLLKLFIYKKIVLKKYAWVEIRKNVKGKKLENKSAYLIAEIAWTIFSSTDMIILSIFCSTQMSSIYSIYNMVFLALSSLLNSVYNSLKYILGQLYFENKEEYIKYHDTFNSIFFGIMTILMCVSFLLIIPFVKLYTSGIEDVNYIYPSLPLLFCLVQMLSWSRYVSGNLTAIAGYAKNTSYISVIESIINIILSLIFVRIYGMEGVLVATVCALPLKVIYCNYLSEKVILKRSICSSLLILGGNWTIFILTVYIFNAEFFTIASMKDFFITGIILVISYSIVVFFLNLLINKNFKKFMFNILKRGEIK